MILEGEIKDAKMGSFFYLISKHSLNKISFVFSLRIINEFEKTNSKAFFKNIFNENLVAF